MRLTDDTASKTEELWFLNSWVTIRRPSRASADGVSIIEHRMPCGDSAPLHRHQTEDEIFHVLEGTIRFRLGEREIVAGPGETMVAPKGVPHTFRVESPEGARCLTIVPGAGFEDLVRAIARPAGAHALPTPAAPTPDEAAALFQAAAENRIDILGPPM